VQVGGGFDEVGEYVSAGAGADGGGVGDGEADKGGGPLGRSQGQVEDAPSGHPGSCGVLSRRTREPRPLARPGRSAGCAGRCPNPGPGRRIVSKTARHGVSRIAGQAGSQARPYAPIRTNPGKQGPNHYEHPPCRLGAPCDQLAADDSGAQIVHSGV
jgi:hypothetical protein